MSLLGQLTVNLVAKLKGWGRNESVGKAQKRLKDFGKQTEETSKKLSRFATAARAGVAALAGGAVTGFVFNTLRSVDALSKKALLLDINIEKLQAFQFAASQSGVNVESLTTGIQRMTRRISEASLGGGSAFKAIQELGLNAEKLAKLNTAEQFRVIAAALSRVANQSDKIRLAMALFDTEGVPIIQMVDRLDDLINKFGDVGVAIDEDMAAKATAATDKIDELATAWKGVAAQLANVASPAVLGLLERLALVLRLSNQGLLADKRNVPPGTREENLEAAGRVLVQQMMGLSPEQRDEMFFRGDRNRNALPAVGAMSDRAFRAMFPQQSATMGM